MANTTKQFARKTSVQHPDTREVHVFEKDEKVPDWALTVLTGRAFKRAEGTDEINLGPVPGFGSRRAVEDAEEGKQKQAAPKAKTESEPKS